MFHPPRRGTALARGAIPSMEYTIYEEQMILGHLSPPVASAGSHGHKWREITTKVTDASNNEVNNNMPASNVLVFSLTIHLIDLCGSIVGLFDDGAERMAFYALISTSQQSRHIASKIVKRSVRGRYRLASSVG